MTTTRREMVALNSRRDKMDGFVIKFIKGDMFVLMTFGGRRDGEYVICGGGHDDVSDEELEKMYNIVLPDCWDSMEDA